MRVLIATGAYPPEIGGPATYSKRLHDELPKSGITVDVLPFSAAGRLPKIIKHIAYFFLVLKRGATADVIFAQDPVSVGLPASFAAFILQKPFVLKMVGDYSWEQGVQRFGLTTSIDAYVKNPDDAPWLVRVLRSIELTVSRRAARVIVPSRYLRDIVETWGVPRERIAVIANAVETDVQTGSKPILRGLVRFSGKVVITVGRLVPWKHFDEIIDAVPKLKSEFPDMRLLVVGSGPLMAELEEKAKARKVESEVVFTGALPRDVLMNYLKMADAFVLNSSYEGFSHQILEALSVGVPTVVSDAGGNPEIIDHGVNGLIVPRGDTRKLSGSLIQILSDTGLRTQLAAAGKKKARTFSVERMIRETTAVLEAAARP